MEIVFVRLIFVTPSQNYSERTDMQLLLHQPYARINTLLCHPLYLYMQIARVGSYVTL